MAWVDSKTSAGIGILTLNNPKKLNPLSKELIDDLCARSRGYATARGPGGDIKGTTGIQGLLSGSRYPGVADERARPPHL